VQRAERDAPAHNLAVAGDRRCSLNHVLAITVLLVAQLYLKIFSGVNQGVGQCYEVALISRAAVILDNGYCRREGPGSGFPVAGGLECPMCSFIGHGAGFSRLRAYGQGNP
jgi:hypothetical protein